MCPRGEAFCSLSPLYGGRAPRGPVRIPCRRPVQSAALLLRLVAEIMLQGLRRLRKSEVFTFRTFGVPRGPLNPLHYYCVCCPLGRREFFFGLFFRPGRPGGPSIGCSILMFAAMWVPPGFPWASVLWFFQLLLRRGRPGGPSIRCSILRFAAIWPAPGCSVLLFFGFRSASRLARVSCAPLGLARGSIGGPPDTLGTPKCASGGRRGPAPGCSAVLLFGFWLAPRFARSPPHAPGPPRRLGPTSFFKNR